MYGSCVSFWCRDSRFGINHGEGCARLTCDYRRGEYSDS